MRVLPDVAALRREFDYCVPETWHDDGRAGSIVVGSMVRAELHGRRIAGWVTALDPEVEAGVTLRPLTRHSGVGPPADLVALARWAAWRWAGAPAALLRTASPPSMVSGLGDARPSAPIGGVPDWAREPFEGDGAIVRVPPLGDRWPLILAAVARGNALVLVPSIRQAQVVVGRLRRLGVVAALHPRDWAAGAAGATVVGPRTAAFAPVAGLAAIVMIDEHDEVYQSEQAPTWHAREVLMERAARAGVPFVSTSPMPTPEAQAHQRLLVPGRSAERVGWPIVRAIDLREDTTARGTLWTSALIRSFDVEGRIAVILNRKGRARLLACATCDSLATCTECDGAMRQPDRDGAGLVCANGHERPMVCDACGATRLKQLRVGVSRAREELEALLREPVAEVTGDDDEIPSARVLVGTEAVLHRVDELAVAAFVDFDQELVALRYRAAEQALGLLVRAGRLVGGRREHSGEVIVQTRQPHHPVIRAAITADVEVWSSSEMARRRLFRYPPYAALAHVSGASAEAFVERLGEPLGVEVHGPTDGAWLLRADDPTTLADALAAVERPKGRLRVAVDPLRI